MAQDLSSIFSPMIAGALLPALILSYRVVGVTAAISRCCGRRRTIMQVSLQGIAVCIETFGCSIARLLDRIGDLQCEGRGNWHAGWIFGGRVFS